MARLGLHPNVCDVKWVDTLKDGTPYLVMPFIKGTTLAQRVKAEGRLTPAEVRVVLLEVASALAAAHRRGIVHRDVRPDNILREEETGKNILSDFGIAGVLETGDQQNPKITRTGEFLGDPAFISPEQLDERPLTDRSDIYSLGVTGYQLLTGHTPPPEEATAGKPGKRVANALAAYAEGLTAVDRRLVELIIRCLAKDPGHRPTATDIVRRLKQDVIEANRNEYDNPDEENIVKTIFQKRLPHILLGYIAAAWMVLEFTQYLVNRLFLHPLAESLVLATIPFGFLAATILGWFHGKKGRQEITPAEGWLLAALGVAWAGVSAWILFASLPGG